MANQQNLRVPTSEEAREMGRKGGKASAEARARRKTLREELLVLLSDNNVQERISAALIEEALSGNRAGSVTRAFETIRDTIGEKPVEKVMLAEVDQAVIDEVEKAVLEDDEGTGC